MVFTDDPTPDTREVRGEHGQLEAVTLSMREWGVLDWFISVGLIDNFDDFTAELDRERGSDTLQDRLEDAVSVKLHHLVESNVPPFDELDDDSKQEYFDHIAEMQSGKYNETVQ